MKKLPTNNYWDNLFQRYLHHWSLLGFANLYYPSFGCMNLLNILYNLIWSWQKTRTEKIKRRLKSLSFFFNFFLTVWIKNFLSFWMIQILTRKKRISPFFKSQQFLKKRKNLRKLFYFINLNFLKKQKQQSWQQNCDHWNDRRTTVWRVTWKDKRRNGRIGINHHRIWTRQRRACKQDQFLFWLSNHCICIAWRIVVNNSVKNGSFIIRSNLFFGLNVK